jgi:hypothetical protein
MSSVPIMVSDGRRVCSRRRGQEDKSRRAERDSRNSKSAKSHGNLPFMLGGAAAPQKHPPLRQSVTPTPQMKPPSQVGNGENYPSLDSPDRGVASLILGVGEKQSRADANVRFDLQSRLQLGRIGLVDAVHSPSSDGRPCGRPTDRVAALQMGVPKHSLSGAGRIRDKGRKRWLWRRRRTGQERPPLSESFASRNRKLCYSA